MVNFTIFQRDFSIKINKIDFEKVILESVKIEGIDQSLINLF